MKRYLLWATVAAFLLVGPLGCGNKEVEELTAKVNQLDKELAEANDVAVEKGKEAEELRAKANQTQATVEVQAAEIVKVKNELDALRRELAALKKKKR